MLCIYHLAHSLNQSNIPKGCIKIYIERIKSLLITILENLSLFIFNGKQENINENF